MQVVVVGQGYVGLPLALTLAEKNMICYGLDTSRKKVNNLSAGKQNLDQNFSVNMQKILKKRKYIPTLDYSVILKADVVVVCLPTPLNLFNKPSLSIIENSLKKISKMIKKRETQTIKILKAGSFIFLGELDIGIKLLC